MMVVRHENRTSGHRLAQLTRVQVISICTPGPKLALFAVTRHAKRSLLQLGTPGPNQSIDHEHVLPFVPQVADICLWLLPEQFAGCG